MGKFFWLKLKKDFFKRHDLLNLRSMENGLTFEAIFIHLMTEAIDHEGYLRYSDKKAYYMKHDRRGRNRSSDSASPKS